MASRCQRKARLEHQAPTLGNLSDGIEHLITIVYVARIALQRLYHANVVVNDLRAAAASYARIFGITHWQIHHWTPERLGKSQAYGYVNEFGYCTATGSNPHGITFRLVQPTQGFSTFSEFLITRGEGVHSVALTRDAVPPGVTVGQSDSTSVMLDTRSELGGYFVEVSVSEAPPPDEAWDLSAEADPPPGVEWLHTIPRVGHFGIAVSNLMQRLPAYAELLGIDRWSGVHFHSLELSTYQGQVVDNAWLLAITDVADFGLELLQGTREPTDYRLTIDRIGEGIHHMLVRDYVSDSEWIPLRDWMASMQIGIVMSGAVPNGAEFFYLDTRAALGYLLEIRVARPRVSGAPSIERFALDFTKRVDHED